MIKKLRIFSFNLLEVAPTIYLKTFPQWPTKKCIWMQTNIGRCKQIYIDAKFQDRF